MLRASAIGGLLVLAVAALVATARAPQLTVEADALRLAYPPARIAGTAGAALLLAGAAALATDRRVKWALGVAVALGLLHTASLAAWTVRADADALYQRGLLGSRVLRWSEVATIVNDPAGLVVTAGDGRALRVETEALSPQHRAALERSVARRIEAARPRP
ncbi:MAG: hypothetical protein NDJ94_09115 [Vicinamibacteria bacterium]|nr:hypothetical protein [Vicinamibacteria bacterium]